MLCFWKKGYLASFFLVVPILISLSILASEILMVARTLNFNNMKRVSLHKRGILFHRMKARIESSALHTKFCEFASHTYDDNCDCIILIIIRMATCKEKEDWLH